MNSKQNLLKKKQNFKKREKSYVISGEKNGKSLYLPLLNASFADKKEDMDMRLEKIYKEFSDIFVSRKGRYVRAARLSDFHSRLGIWSDDLDNVLYGEIGMSCEEIVRMLRQGNVSV